MPRGVDPSGDPLAPQVPKSKKPYYLDLLRLKDQLDTALPPAGRPQWMQKHLAYMRSQVEAGKFVLVRPITGENRLCGIAIIKADSTDEVQHLATGDQSGHPTLEVHPFLLEDSSSIRFGHPGENNRARRRTKSTRPSQPRMLSYNERRKFKRSCFCWS